MELVWTSVRSRAGPLYAASTMVVLSPDERRILVRLQGGVPRGGQWVGPGSYKASWKVQFLLSLPSIFSRGGEMVDTLALEASACKGVWVQIPPSVPKVNMDPYNKDFLDNIVVYGPKSNIRTCDCCKKWKHAGDFCGLYGCCEDCAFCQSLDQCGKCCHGKCKSS